MIDNGKLINPEVRIEVTNMCNAHCIICPREKMTRKGQMMEYALYRNILDQIKDLEAELISLFGFGEPLLHVRIDRMVADAHLAGFKTFITTNGSLLDRDLSCKLMDSGLDDIRISFHSVIPSEYEKIHQGLKFYDVLKKVNDFADLRAKHGWHTNIHIVMVSLGLINVPLALEFWKGKADFVEIWRPHNWTDGRRYRGLTEKRKPSCHRPFRGPLQIQVDGTIVPCCFVTNNEYVCGDASKQSLIDVLDSCEYRFLRDMHGEGTLSGIVCGECDQLNVEEVSPLIYSSRNKEGELDRTYGAQFQLAS